MKYIVLSLALLTLHYSVFGQITPDLIQEDHYRPYVQEGAKQKAIVDSYWEKSGRRYPQTSEEIYPQLYRFVNRDYLGPIKGTSNDPSNAFPNYSREPVVKTGSYNSVNPLYNQNRSIDERNLAAVEADLATYEARKLEAEKIINEASEILEKPILNYHLGMHSGEQVDPFILAQQEITAMLSGHKPIDFLKAVFLVENSVDRTLTWKEFNSMFQDGVQVIGSLMARGKLSTNDNLAKIMTIYKYMTDTTTVYVASKEKTVTTKPMLYDYEDYEAKKDVTKIFVSKLLRTGSGQCMSLPTLYYLFAKTINANVNLAFAPQHSYITFTDHKGNRQNIELTGKMFTSSDFYWATGFIKAEQVKAGIYLKPLTEKETLAHFLTTLSLTYIKKFGTDERALEMAITARKHSPSDLTANMIIAGYSQDLYNHILRQYDVFRLSKNDLQQDEQAQAARENMSKAISHLKKDLGYSEMPDWAYKQWLDGVNALALKKQHEVKKRMLEQQLNR